MSVKAPLPSFSNSRLPILTVLTNRSGSPSLSMSPKAAATPIRSSTATPARSVTFSNFPPPTLRHSSFAPIWVVK